MTAAELVIDRLGDISGVTSLVSTRIYNVKLPQNPTLPAIRVQRVSEEEPVHLRGVSGVVRCRVQVDAVSSEDTTADPVAQATAVDAAAFGDGGGSGLCGWKGEIDGVIVRSILPAGVREGYDADELRQFKVMRDYWVTYSR